MCLAHIFATIINICFYYFVDVLNLFTYNINDIKNLKITLSGVLFIIIIIIFCIVAYQYGNSSTFNNTFKLKKKYNVNIPTMF